MDAFVFGGKWEKDKETLIIYHCRFVIIAYVCV